MKNLFRANCCFFRDEFYEIIIPIPFISFVSEIKKMDNHFYFEVVNLIGRKDDIHHKNEKELEMIREKLLIMWDKYLDNA